jgi:Cft2 family RNA processing exonuclease
LAPFLITLLQDWLYGEGRGQDISTYQARQKTIRTAAEAIFKRSREVTLRADAVAKAQKLLKTVNGKVSTWADKLPHITAEEREKVLAAATKAADWLEEKLTLQLEKTPFETPAFESSEVTAQFKVLNTLFEKTAAKPKPAPPVVEKVRFVM